MGPLGILCTRDGSFGPPPPPGSRIPESLLYHILSLSVSSLEQIALEIRTTSPETISITSPLVCEYISGHLSRILLATFTACATVIDIGSGVCHIESFRISRFSFFFFWLFDYFTLTFLEKKKQGEGGGEGKEGERAMKTYNINKENARVPRTTYATNIGAVYGTGAVYGNGWTRVRGVCQLIEVLDSFVYASGICWVLVLAASCAADYESRLFWKWAVSFLGEQEYRWRGDVGGGFTISTVLSEGIDPVGRSALAFNVGLAGTSSLVGGTAKLALGRIVGAGRNDFSEGVRTRSVATVGGDMILGMPSMMLTRVAIVRNENKKTQVNFILQCFG